MRPPSHPPQSTACAQLSVAPPHRESQKFGSTAQPHVCVVESHALFCPQSVLQDRGCPQLSVAFPQCVLQKFGSGVQSLAAGPPMTPLSPTSWPTSPSATPLSSVVAASCSESSP
ncbi:MAG: hypothetical protein ACREJX_14240 [Polyangiaceae bacterium]